MRMKGLITALAVLAVVGQAQAAAPAEADRAALMALAAANDEAWDAGDADRIGAQYAADGTLRIGHIEGTRRGRDSIRTYFATVFAGRPQGLRHITRIDHIEMIRDDLAFADGIVRVERAGEGGTWTLMRTFRNHSVAVRENGTWRLHSVRAQRIDDAPAAP